MPKANRKYKDSVFTMYFSNTERLIELYNSLEGTNLPKDTPIEINTLDDALFKDRINDISFVINGELVVLIEHQSTLNENMPVRFLLYVARVYEKILETENVYRSSRIPLPTPKFVVLYNGLEPSDEFSEMRLSDAFILPEKAPMLDLMVRFFNINYGKSPSIMEKCHSLNEYSTFVFYVRKNQARGLPLNKAIAEAVNQAIHNNVMKDFLSQHGSEVENMLFEEWKWDAKCGNSSESPRTSLSHTPRLTRYTIFRSTNSSNVSLPTFAFERNFLTQCSASSLISITSAPYLRALNFRIADTLV